jgi:hypothetical protein
MLNEAKLRDTRYSIRRFQGFVESTGLPVPGLFRIEGSIDFNASSDSSEWIGIL